MQVHCASGRASGVTPAVPARQKPDVKQRGHVVETTSIGSSTFDRLAADFGGQLIRPDDPAFDEARTVFNGMIDRRPALVARPAGHGGRDRGSDVCTRTRAADRGSLRRAQCRRPRHERRRARDRPVLDEGRSRRSGAPGGARERRRQLGRVRPRDAGLRPRDAGRARDDDRRGRLHARRRLRVDLAEVRTHLRQPRLGRRRHGGRPAADGERERERGALLGAPRRRRQLRRGHVVRVQGLPGRSDRVRGADGIPRRARGRSDRHLATKSARQRPC